MNALRQSLQMEPAEPSGFPERRAHHRDGQVTSHARDLSPRRTISRSLTFLARGSYHRR